jgi:putative hemolysin
MIVPDIAVIALLIAVSGFFSIFEQALANAKKTRLQMEAGSGSGGKAKRYGRALEAAEKPNMLLAAARAWAWTLRIIAAVVSGLHINRLTEPRLLAEIAYIAALAAACLIFGDFLPRIITRREPERIAAATLPLITFFALPFRLLYFLGSKIFWPPELSSKEGQSGITEDELRLALMEGEKSGIVESKERTMV